MGSERAEKSVKSCLGDESLGDEKSRITPPSPTSPKIKGECKMIDLTRKPESFLKHCPSCKGEGFVQTEEAQKYNRLFEQFRKTGLDTPEAHNKAEEEMKAENPFFRIEDVTWEVTCWKCNGEGKVLSQELQHLAQLITMIERYEFED
jgi:hypothetical protein